MKTAWAPWRIEYILGQKEPGCVFCRAQTTDTDLTLYTGDEVLVVMNKYPYINGHLLVAPKQHVGSLSDLSQ
ncbi:MAG: HIT domain-containing protein, partial [Deltaproteobacteria bacterium]|nr:HIT domain-containing protein [Deltaproteobacteria bacterium]